MLVLSRKIGEEIVIAGNVCVRIAGIEGKRVKLSISCRRQTFRFSVARFIVSAVNSLSNLNCSP